MPVANIREYIDAEECERIEYEPSYDEFLFDEFIELADILDEMEVA